MAHDVVLIPGDGIGPEITSAMRRVVEATGVQINWNVQNAGAGVMDEFGTPLPEHVLEAVRATKVAIILDGRGGYGLQSSREFYHDETYHPMGSYSSARK